MTPTEFLTGWAALLVVFVLIISRIPRPDKVGCPPHVWGPPDMGDNPKHELVCRICGDPPKE